MLRWTEFLAHQERLEDLRREAQGERLVQQVLATREKRHHAYHRLAAWLGCLLVTWGARLLERCGRASTACDSWAFEPRREARCVAVDLMK